ncbi:hypothetical protein BN3087_810013 [Sulfurovum sp. enrichment culture clone C5]|uniref:Uncharacterized protein n=1 Tax=Sulfurovum sp. enrichment culture clone C5 TaxID=497650 RepID=A0A0S4XR06_9BACT|nr:hypothetical protein BN3087_810013 [Sulfurovum sp. enrichment culture clone C5]
MILFCELDSLRAYLLKYCNYYILKGMTNRFTS